MKIGNHEFPTKAAAETFIRELLSKWKGQPFISGDDAQFVQSLLALHPRQHLIIDCGLKHIKVQEIDKGYLRFLAVRVDSSIRDFSWRNCLSPKSQRSQVMSICRSVVDPQIIAFRNDFWRNRKTADCPVTSEPMTIRDSDVDHAPPNTFAVLVEQWLRVVRSDFELIEIEYRSGYEERYMFAERWLEGDWSEYHMQLAELRVVSRTANRSILRRKVAHV
jgi:hypothetical protein